MRRQWRRRSGSSGPPAASSHILVDVDVSLYTCATEPIMAMMAAAAASTRRDGHSPRPCVEWSGEAGRRRQEQPCRTHRSRVSLDSSILRTTLDSPVPLTTHYSLAPPPSHPRPAPLLFLLPSLPSLPPPSIVSWFVYQADHHHRHHHHHHHSQRRGAPKQHRPTRPRPRTGPRARDRTRTATTASTR